MAISYYEKAIEQGDKNAPGYLNKLRRRSGFAVGQILLPKAELAKAELAKAELAKAELAKAELAKAELAKAELAKAELAKAELAKAELAKAELAKAELAKAELAKAELAKAELAKAELAKAELAKAAPVKQNTGDTYEVSSARVNLTEVANQCSNYTTVGFDYYGESIEGALLVGSAKIRSIEPSSSQSNARLINLFRNQSGTVVFLALDKVPREVASKLKKKSNFAITGIVTRARMIGSHCEINLSYQTAESQLSR
jgi:multidrug efflux pump subunit AcrA (membrane-fusion protein)